MDTIAGVIDTFIKGILKDAPKNFESQVLGITTDIEKYSVGKCLDCITSNGKNYKFSPNLFEENTSK